MSTPHPLPIRHGPPTTGNNPLRSAGVRSAAAVLVLVLLVALATAIPSLPATADEMQLSRSGNQESGRWQTFSLDPSLGQELDVRATWTGGGDVNLFLKDASGRTRAKENAQQSHGPISLNYRGRHEVVTLAVLVKSGSADWDVVVSGGDNNLDPQPPAVTEYPGQPVAGSIYFGASQQGNGDPWDRIESHTGHRVGVRRTFFRWDQRSGYMVRIARDDTAVGRLPWVSVKPPSWTAMASGSHDAQIDDMLHALDGVDGPVWLTVAHEPEGGEGNNSSDDDGGPSAWLGMQRKVRSRIDALGVDNVALVPIFMTWTWDPRSGRNPDQWYAPGIFDLLGTDLYDRSGDGLPPPSGAWQTQRNWAEARGLDMAVAEWGVVGNGDDAAQRMRDWRLHVLNTAFDDRGARVVAMSVYDNDYGDWRMSGDKLHVFGQMVSWPAHVNTP